MANDIVLIRKTGGQFARYTNCSAVTLTGQTSEWGSVTGVAATNFVVVPGSAFIAGQGVTFASLTGGAGLNTGAKYYVVNPSGGAFQLATSQGGAVIDFTTNITAGTLILQDDELMVWSSEYRDIFNPAGITIAAPPNASGQGGSTTTMTASTVSNITVNPAAGGFNGTVSGTLGTTNSDEIIHNPLRQTFLARTHWKFTMSSGPTPLYATWADGDIIANNPPNT